MNIIKNTKKNSQQKHVKERKYFGRIKRKMEKKLEKDIQFLLKKKKKKYQCYREGNKSRANAEAS